jgi:very-short-patch-repair endonuclease
MAFWSNKRLFISPLSPSRERVRERGKSKVVKKPQPVTLARELRRNETKAEQIIWSWLRNKHLYGAKFRRQQPIGNYIVDFVSFDCNLVIEIDGGQHNDDRNAEKDGLRTKWLESRGFQVIRFWNSDVLENPEGVLDTLTLTLSHQGRGN